jgi:hypothetical protein
MVVDPNTGSITMWWNHGANPTAGDGWLWVEGGQIAPGVPHANWVTLRFPDINGDGRADYVYIGQGGSLHLYMNLGSVGGLDVSWHDRGGIATGAVANMADLVFGDVSFIPLPLSTYLLLTVSLI